VIAEATIGVYQTTVKRDQLTINEPVPDFSDHNVFTGERTPPTA